MIFIQIFIILFVLMFVFHVLTKSYLNPYKLIMVIGKKGSGKTTYLTKQAIKHLRSGWQVYSTVYIPGTNLFEVSDLGKFTFPPDSLVLIDEVGLIWDNRDFSSFPKYVRDFFKFQRQYRIKVILFSQIFDIDKKLRDLTDQMFILTNQLRVFSVARRIVKNITIYKGGEGRPSTLADDFTYAPLLSPSSIDITWIPRWTVFFKSFNPPYLKFIKYEYAYPNEFQVACMSNKYFWRFWLQDRCIGFKSFLKTLVHNLYNTFYYNFCNIKWWISKLKK